MNRRVFRDPVHSLIEFDEGKKEDKLIIDLLNSKEVQRLRRIRQLGLSFFTFPGAEHSRFTHTLGVVYLARKILERLSELPQACMPGGQSLNIDELYSLVMAVAVLHDIGHGPFSHVAERKQGGKKHEHWTIDIISDKQTEVHQILTNYNSALPGMVKEVIGRIFKPTWVVKLISSQLDADRLDYLFRDSLMTGTGYGKFDLDWLLNVLRIGMVNGDYEIGLDYEKGVKVAETFIMARYSMYLQVYYHKTTRGAEVLLDRILNRAAEVVDKCEIESGDALLKLIKGENISVSEYLDLDDNVLVALIKDWAKSEDGILSDLCTRFLHRRLFKSIDISSVSGHAIAFAEKYNRAKSICGKQFPPEYYLASDSAENSPYKDYYIFPPGGEGEKDEKVREATEQIYLFPKDLNPEELSNASDVVKALRNRKYIKERLYFPAEMREKINEIFA